MEGFTRTPTRRDPVDLFFKKIQQDRIMGAGQVARVFPKNPVFR
jgi:hypothetical protein